MSLTASFLAVLLFCATPAVAMQILEAADHAELVAVVSDRAVSRITLADDRVARVVRGAEGFAVEHDAARGDLYLRPLKRASADPVPVTLFIGTAKGFTYKLSLRRAVRDSAQILIRNAAATPRAERQGPSGGRVSALAALIRAVARRETPPGYVVETPGESLRLDGFTMLEVWRGGKFTARIYEADPAYEVHMKSLEPGAAALWRAPVASGPSGGTARRGGA